VLAASLDVSATLDAYPGWRVRRAKVHVDYPRNATVAASPLDSVAVVSPCALKAPTQTWVFRNASAGNTLAQAAFASVAAAVALEEDEPTMDMTVAVGGILRTAASVATPAAAAPSMHTAAAASSIFTPDPAALTTDNGYGDEFGVTPGRLSARVGVASAGGTRSRSRRSSSTVTSSSGCAAAGPPAAIMPKASSIQPLQSWFHKAR
jgi:hypothetical protein